MKTITWEKRHTDEMFNIITTQSLTCRPENRYRQQTVAQLIAGGYMIAKSDVGNPDYMPQDTGYAAPVSTTLTERGKQWFLNLKPENFTQRYFFERGADDIRRYQERIQALDFARVDNPAIEFVFEAEIKSRVNPAHVVAAQLWEYIQETGMDVERVSWDEVGRELHRLYFADKE